jgi:hypothetical protein
MVSAVAGVRAYGMAPPADGQATLDRLQHQLSDNVNCASARTPEGKATIAALEDRIAALKDRMAGKAPAYAAASAPAEPAAAARTGSASGGVIDVYV